MKDGEKKYIFDESEYLEEEEELEEEYPDDEIPSNGDDEPIGEDYVGGSQEQYNYQDYAKQRKQNQYAKNLEKENIDGENISNPNNRTNNADMENKINRGRVKEYDGTSSPDSMSDIGTGPKRGKIKEHDGTAASDSMSDIGKGPKSVSKKEDRVLDTTKKGLDSKNVLNPKESLKEGIKGKLKDKISEKSEVADKALKVADTVKNIKFLISLMSNPTFWCVVGGVLVVIILIILIAAIAGVGGSGEGEGGMFGGYYDPKCNFNNVSVTYGLEDGLSGLSLEEFVIGSTYYYTNNLTEEGRNRDFNDEGLKTLLIIVKTNALAYGNYNNDESSLLINVTEMNYIPESDINSSDYNKLKEIYDTIVHEIYVSDIYSEEIESLVYEDVLNFNDDILNQIENIQKTKTYKDILDELYNSSEDKKVIYSIQDHCTFYSLSENEYWWWPVGSDEPSNGNIYGGKPSSTYISSYFGPRVVNGKPGKHKGIDIDGKNNVPVEEKEVVIAAKDGTVSYVVTGCTDSKGYQKDNCGGGFGNHVIISHGNGVETIYAHMYQGTITVKKDQKVKQGEKLGLIGNTGSSTGEHLHFQINVNGTPVNPLDGYIDPSNPRPVSVSTKLSSGLVIVGDTSNLVPGDQTKRAICKSLVASGFSTNAVAGMLTNIAYEGSFNLTNLENCYEENACCTLNGKDYGFCVHKEIAGFGSDSGYTAGVDSGAYPREKFVNDRAGYGLIQWTSGGRKGNLYDYAKDIRKSIGSLSTQLGHLWNELQNYNTTYKYVTGNYSAYDITYNFCIDFERPSDKYNKCKNRAQNSAQNMLTYVENGCN